ncbi:MAG: hypothetical protein JRN15_21950 [Nitrososphaerota archaeon]|nr:hypothetical protein [Nitrososphaerota archaeon]
MKTERAADEVERWSSIEALQDFLKTRLTAPWGHFTFLAFFIIGIIGVGGFGLWKEFYTAFHLDKWSAIPFISALQTYFPAIAVASTFELVTAEKHPKYVRSFAFVMTLLIFALAFLTAMPISVAIALSFGILGAIVAIALWVIGNAENAAYQDPPPGNCGNRWRYGEGKSR